MLRKAPVVAALIASLLVVVAPSAFSQSTPPPPPFLETFDFDASQPAHYMPPGWDISVIAHDNDMIEPMWAEHGPNCEPPDDQWVRGTQPSSTSNHHITQAAETTYDCRNHIMTAINAGYGAVYLTPPAMLDFSAGPATVSWDMSTQRVSPRDWVDIVIMPFQPERSDLPLPMALNMIDAHFPTEAIWIDLQGANTFMPHHLTKVPPANGCSSQSYTLHPAETFDCRFHFDLHTWDTQLATFGLSPSAARRDNFRIEISQTHLKVGFRPTPSSPYFNWTDDDIPGGLNWNHAIVQLNHRSYNPLKGCGAIGVGEAGAPPDGWYSFINSNGGLDGCRAGTWHWDNVAVSPQAPFTILYGARRVRDGDSVTFPTTAPPNSWLKLAGDWDALASFDGGATYSPLQTVGVKLGPQNGISYFSPIPAGVQTVKFQVPGYQTSLEDIYLYSLTPRDGVPLPPTPTQTATPLPTSTPPVVLTSTPTATAAVGSTPTPTPTFAPTSTPTGTSTPVPVKPTQEPTATPAPPSDQPTPTPASTVVPGSSAACALVRYDPDSGSWTLVPMAGDCTAP
jgi:hypothetical protein